MKKILSLLLATVACSTVFAVTAFANTNLTMTVSPEEVKAGETVTVTLEVGEMSASSFAAGIAFDTTKFTATSVAGPDADYPSDIYLLDKNGRAGRNFVFPIADPDLAASKNTGRIGATWNGSETEFESGLIFTVTFEAAADIAEGDVYFNAFESLDSTNNANDRALDGKEGRNFAATKKVTVIGNKPTASVAITAAKKTTDANWVAEYGNTMFWGVDFANAGFNGEALVKIFSDDKERELIVKTPADAEVNGEASFGVFVIVGDSEDALGLTVTSGDVTATAAPVAYADAE